LRAILQPHPAQAYRRSPSVSAAAAARSLVLL
jgi:hypothetical protein